MKKTDFYDLSPKWSEHTFSVVPKNGFSEEIKLFDANYTNIDFPVPLKIRTTGKYGDWVWGGCVGILLVSDRLKKLLENHRLTG